MPPFRFRRRLGRTGLEVSALGIGCGNGISSRDLLYAYDQGVNFFFYSTDLHHQTYRRAATALRTLCGRRSPHREKVVLALVTYTRHPAMLNAVLFDQFSELGLDYVDVLLWGWIDRGERAAARLLLRGSPEIRGRGSLATRTVEQWFGTSARLKRYGAIRHIGMSFHDTLLAQELVQHPGLDVAMLRYNPAHRHGEERVLARLPGTRRTRPGTVTFNSLHGERGFLWQPGGAPAPKGVRAPGPADCYRFALSHPAVDVCLAGPTSRAQLTAALQASQQGPLPAADVGYLQRYGDAYRGRAEFASLLRS
jgi:aryl-alcohol dehydrogenase-like predicted oxidoreductase